MATTSWMRDQASWWHELAPLEKGINICGIEYKGGIREYSGYMEVRLPCGVDRVVHATMWVKMGQNANRLGGARFSQGSSKLEQAFSDGGSLPRQGTPRQNHADWQILRSFGSMIQIKFAGGGVVSGASLQASNDHCPCSPAPPEVS
jgi:hypothetical protein